MHLFFACTFFIVFIVAMCITIPILRWTRKIGCIDMPDAEGHKTHKEPTPLAGGLIISVILLLLLAVRPHIFNHDLTFITICALLTGLFGFVDDLYGLRARWKLLGQFIAAGVLISSGVTVHLTPSPMLNCCIAALWLIGITNAFNLIDGLDGLATGLAAIALAFLSFISIGSGQYALATLTTTVLASVVWLYYLNIAPARLFLGDAGSQMLGFFIAAALLIYTPPGFTVSTSWFLPIMLMGVAIFDTSLVVTSRLLKHQPIYVGGKDHIHHRLISTGMGINRASLTIHLISVAISILGFFALESTAVTANLIFFSMCLIGVGIIVYLNRNNLKAN